MNKARFLENLRSERKKRRLTQSRVAEVLGISDKTYSKWETGENEPDIDSLCRLADFYGTTPVLFFQEEDDSHLAGMDAAEAAQMSTYCWAFGTAYIPPLTRQRSRCPPRTSRKSCKCRKRIAAYGNMPGEINWP